MRPEVVRLDEYMPSPAPRAKAVVSLAQLREQLKPPHRPTRLPMGSEGLEAWLGGWPQPGVVEIAGSLGSGRLSPVLPALRRLQEQGRPLALVDPLARLFPPGLGLERCLLLRPPSAQAAWTAEQLLRSGALDAVLLVDGGRLGKAGPRLLRAAEAGRCTLWILSEQPEAELPATLRLEARGWLGDGRLRLHCSRGRGGAEGERWLPPEVLSGG